MSKRITDIGKIHQQVYNDLAHVNKVSEAGLAVKPIGALATAVLVRQHQPVVLYNSDVAIHYVAFGDQAVAAPTTAANGLPIPPGAIVIYNSGLDNWVRSDSALVFGYAADSE